MEHSELAISQVQEVSANVEADFVNASHTDKATSIAGEEDGAEINILSIKICVDSMEDSHDCSHHKDLTGLLRKENSGNNLIDG